MNIVTLSGRLTGDPKIFQNNDNMSARYTLACDRRVRKDAPEGTQTTDFISCVVFGKGAEFTDKYLRKGTKMIIKGRLSTGKYVNSEGQTIYTTDVVVEEQEFAESKRQGEVNQGNDAPAQTQAVQTNSTPKPTPRQEAWMNVPDDAENDLPFA